MHMIAKPTKCVEFGLRRAQGPNGALTASKYAMMGGFVGTSNMQAGHLYDLNLVGTLAHSMIMSYEEESDCS
jgi:nicotinate phosphoribosyltransferase